MSGPLILAFALAQAGPSAVAQPLPPGSFQLELRGTDVVASAEARDASVTEVATRLQHLLGVPVRTSPGLATARVSFRKLRDGLMFLPLIAYTGGYGLSYGAQFSFANVLGKRSRIGSSPAAACPTIRSTRCITSSKSNPRP